MQVPQIRMESQLAQIQIQHTPSNQQISQPEAELSIQQPQAELSMNTTPSKLQIDQTKAWEDMNVMHIFKWNAKNSQAAQSDWLNGLERRTQQGAELMKIESDGAPISNQAVTNAFDDKRALGIDFIPSPFAVETNYQPSTVQIDVQTYKPIINAEARSPVHQYEPGSVETSMKQYQHLEIDVINLFT
ncbi:hypothetical protein J2Z83_003308 [Virgibacillus natechei]|uniref:Uncharacterized protein n=1 Tax=Virgibacillus natechei TaxID=1216297 RepID=A0ABS4IMF7_9BACI|nr:DUF6470 family protein [Virgibacillus natechei]MBP1971169.1 hypothetical protein [Virgibacillus natechei]UZD11916.1 DUF6470 family protein [Virgibacillus natechei]